MNRIEMAQIDDAYRIAPHLRQLDVQEVKASLGIEPLDALILGIALSASTWTWWRDGEPVIVGGVSPHPEFPWVGVPWSLGTDRVREFRDDWIVESEKVVGLMHDKFATLANYVDARNKPAIHWLRMAGFTIHPPEPYGVEGLPFHLFTREDKRQCALPS